MGSFFFNPIPLPVPPGPGSQQPPAPAPAPQAIPGPDGKLYWMDAVLGLDNPAHGLPRRAPPPGPQTYDQVMAETAQLQQPGELGTSPDKLAATAADFFGRGGTGFSMPISGGKKGPAEARFEGMVNKFDPTDTQQEMEQAVGGLFKEGTQTNEDLERELVGVYQPDARAEQVGTQVGIAQAFEISARESQMRKEQHMAKLEEMGMGLQYPGADPLMVRRWRRIVADAETVQDPRELGPDGYQRYVEAQENLKRAQELPSVEPKGWRKAVNAIAMALGAFGAALSKTPNFAQQYIDGVIDREVARQKEEYERKKTGYNLQQNLYAQAYTEWKDNATAYQAAKALMFQKLGYDLQKQNLQLHGLAQLERSQALKIDMAGKVADFEVRRGLARMGAEIDMLGKSLMGGPKAGSEELRKEALGAVDAIKQLRAYRTEWRKNKTAGPVGTLLGAFPFNATEEVRLNALRDFMTLNFGSALQGKQLNEQELKAIDRIMPRASSLGGEVLLNEMEAIFRRKLKSVAGSATVIGSDPSFVLNYANGELGRGWDSGFQTEIHEADEE